LAPATNFLNQSNILIIISSEFAIRINYDMYRDINIFRLVNYYPQFHEDMIQMNLYFDNAGNFYISFSCILFL